MAPHFDLTEAATADLEDAIAHLALENQPAALNLADELEHAFTFLGEWPGAGHHRQDLTLEPNIRFWNSNGYSIAYDATRRPILVLCVLHGARDLPSVLTSRLEQR